MADDTTAPAPDPNAGGGFGIADALGLVGGLLKTWGNISEQTAYNNALRNVQAKENQIFDQMSKTTPTDVMEGIKANYQGLSTIVRNQIVQAVSSQMAGRGITGNTGMFQVALDEAMASSDDRHGAAGVFSESLAADSVAPAHDWHSSGTARQSVWRVGRSCDQQEAFECALQW
jgi:hypothetical protein